MSAFGKELIDSVHEAIAIAKGTAKPARRYDAEPIDVVAIRKRLQLSQSGFAQKFGLAAGTVRDWEQGRINPHRTARTLLAVIDKNCGHCRSEEDNGNRVPAADPATHRGRGITLH
jgi:putative transcriptional regulator